jgi:predicted HAD superfamily Cof-like phosphohydrolase
MYKDVIEFIKACDQERNENNIRLYFKLINEEYNEFINANNDVETLDACMDMIWVILGYCYMKGWDVQGAWNEVAQSNLSKIDSNTGKVIKREDGKILKPEGWKEPNLSKFCNE